MDIQLLASIFLILHLFRTFSLPVCIYLEYSENVRAMEQAVNRLNKWDWVFVEFKNYLPF